MAVAGYWRAAAIGLTIGLAELCESPAATATGAGTHTPVPSGSLLQRLAHVMQAAGWRASGAEIPR